METTKNKLPKVENFYNRNQFIITIDDEIYLQSYNSIIAKVHKRYGHLYIYDDWDYSKTTLKHLYLFLQDIAMEYCETRIIDLIDKILSSKNKKQALAKVLDSENLRGVL